MNDYARVRSKNEKKKNKRKLSLSSFSLEASFLPFWSVVSKKKKEKREKNRSAFDSLGSFQTTRGRHKRRRRAHRRGVNARRNQKEETEKRS